MFLGPHWPWKFSPKDTAQLTEISLLLLSNKIGSDRTKSTKRGANTVQTCSDAGAGLVLVGVGWMGGDGVGG